MATDLLIDSFRNYLRFERNYSECTVIAYVHDLESFKEFVQAEDEGIDWEHVDADLIRRWIEQLMEKGYTPSSVNRKLSSLRTFYKLLMCRGEVRVSPLTGLRGPKKRNHYPTLSRKRIWTGCWMTLTLVKALKAFGIKRLSKCSMLQGFACRNL